MVTDERKKSPLVEPPLRQAGQSLDQRLHDLLDNEFVPWSIAVAAAFLLTVTEWLRYFTEAKPNPWLYSILTLVISAIAGFRIRKLVYEARLLKLGRDGERVVADHLQELAANGWRVFHDIQGDGFNIDHVVIGPGGIFTVETKTRSKPLGKPARIIVDQNGISVAGSAASRDAIEQALAQSSWLARQLRSSTGQVFPVRAAIVFPNWYVARRTRPKSRDPWVLEPKALVKWLKKERASLNDEQVAMATHHLARLIKAGERN